MSTVQIQERFTIPAPPERVWATLNDPAQLVVCIPGASLDSAGDDRSYAGTVRVKVGAVSIQYGGTVTFEEVDEASRTLKLSGKGSEKGGAGAVRMSMEGQVTADGSGGSEVSVAMDMQLAGKIVRFGRGMIQSVSAELFSQFTSCLAQTLAVPDPVSEGTAEASVGGTAAGPAAGAPDAPGSPESGTRPQAESRSDSVALLPLLWRSFLRWMRSLVGRS